MAVFVGIDWGNETHRACAVDDGGKVLWERSVKHDFREVSVLIDQMVMSGGDDSNQVRVAIERPHGILVEALLERGVQVFAINPKQLDRFRDRFSAAGAKDDRRDARVLADSLRTDSRAFFEVALPPAEQLELQSQSRMRETLSHQIVQASNRLMEQLQRYYPQILKLGSTDEPWIWSLLKLAPTPKKGAKLRRIQTQRLLNSHRIRRLDAEQIRATLRMPGFNVAAGTIDAAAAQVAILIEQLELFGAQEKRCRKEIDRLLRECIEAQLREEPSQGSSAPPTRASDVEIIDSMPGVGSIITATLLSEAGAAVKRRDLTTLRTLCGSAPVTVQSGKSKRVHKRYACNWRLQNACYWMAMNAVRTDELCRAHYARQRAGGSTHGGALRSVADRLLRILVGALRSGTTYSIKRMQGQLDEAA